MHVSVETIVAKIKQETTNLEHALEREDSKERIREHARLIRALSELIGEENGDTSVRKTERPVAVKGEGEQPASPVTVHRPSAEHNNVSGQGNLLEF